MATITNTNPIIDYSKMYIRNIPPEEKELEYTEISCVDFRALGIKFRLPQPIKVPSELTGNDCAMYILCELLGLKKEDIRQDNYLE